MKGLLIKDFLLLKNMKQGFLMIVVMCIAFGWIYESPEFLISYMTLMTSIFMLSTIGFDEQDNGMSFLFTMPVSRKGYVKEKYVFGVLVVCIALIAVTLFSCVIFRLRNIGFRMEEVGGTMLGSFISTMLILAVMTPIQLKFEAEKSRVALMIAMGCVFLAALFLIKLIKMLKFDISAVMDRISAAGPGVMIGIGCAAAVVLVGISMMVSMHIMKKKEF